MTGLTLYHNPDCSKSRRAKEILEASGAAFELVEYLKTPLSGGEIRDLLGKLDAEPGELVRRDDNFRALGLDESACADADAVIGLLVAHPELMQRPVAAKGSKALIARPPERVETLL